MLSSADHTTRYSLSTSVEGDRRMDQHQRRVGRHHPAVTDEKVVGCPGPMPLSLSRWPKISNSPSPEAFRCRRPTTRPDTRFQRMLKADRQEVKSVESPGCHYLRALSPISLMRKSLVPSALPELIESADRRSRYPDRQRQWSMVALPDDEILVLNTVEGHCRIGPTVR